MRGGGTIRAGASLLAMLSAAGLAAPPAPPPACQPGAQCAVVSPAQLFDLAERYANAHRTKEAEAMLRALATNPDADIRAEARFRLGNLYQNSGNLPAAAHAYGELLNEKPNANRVRLELARVLALMGEDDAARGQLRRASSVGLPDDVARVVDQFQSALRSHRRWGANLEVDLAPDSNINHAGARSTIQIGGNTFALSRDAQAQSGVGAALSGQVFWRPKVSNKVNWLTTLSGAANLYGKSAFNDISATVGSGPEFLVGRSRLRAGAVVSRRWFGGRTYSDSRGANLNLLQPLGRKSQLQYDLTVLDNSYHINPQMTGRSVSNLVRYERAFSGRTFGRVSLRVDRQDARVPAFATWTVGGELLLSRDIGRQTLYGRLGYYRTWADGAFNLPPAGRDDKLVDAELGILLRSFSFASLVPVVRLHYTHNASPVFFYAFESKRVEVGLTHEF